MLRTEEVQSYLEHGYLVKTSIFSRLEVEQFRNAAICAEVRAKSLSEETEKYQSYFLNGNRFVDILPQGEESREPYVTVQYEHEDRLNDIVRVIEPVNSISKVFDQLVDDHRIVFPIQQILNTDKVSLWTAKLNLKHPKNGSGFSMHQDSPYWVYDSAHVDLMPNVLIYFDEATEENGPLLVVDKSHTRGILPGRKMKSDFPENFFTSKEEFCEEDIVSITAPAGSAVFFSPHIVHGSRPNLSPFPRRAIILTYQPAGHPTLKSKEVRNVACNKGASQTAARL